eukprot:TRINITY_DN9102_c0_g1_i1.p1 TRINITY_DN9102_c0_g1~~TRINITY_DN9102_c0_g1_i1.p1  ORF type:complete len:361 (-),score=66.85 TRINITY_DN9102_c0_g1_i1:276-1358(-)
MASSIISCLVIILSLVHFQANALSCLDEKGEPISWWLNYRVPDTKEMRLHFLKYTAQDTKPEFSLMEHAIDNDHMPLARTLLQANSKDNLEVLAYSDQPPEEQMASRSKAHAKGVVVIDRKSKSGFLLMHSLPNFPNFKPHNNAPNATLDLVIERSKFGQHFFCTSMSEEALEDYIALALKTNIHIYHSTLPPSKTLKVTKKGQQDPNAIFAKEVKPLLGATHEFVLFSKFKSNDKYLWEELIIPQLKVPMLAETWGRPYMASMCPPAAPHPSRNIISLKFNEEYSWERTQDHSKWGISDDPSQPWICFSDLNRMATQNVRGGSAMCIKHPYMHQAFKKMITDVENCEKSSKQQAPKRRF